VGIARELGHLKRVGNISVDGTKIKADAGKHKAVSYEYAKKQLEVLEGEVKELMAKAEEADSKPLEEGMTIPEEIGRRQERLEAAKREIEARYEEVREGERQEPEVYCAVGKQSHHRSVADLEKKEEGERNGGVPAVFTEGLGEVCPSWDTGKQAGERAYWAHSRLIGEAIWAGPQNPCRFLPNPHKLLLCFEPAGVSGAWAYDTVR
jgi:hypothetical protein